MTISVIYESALEYFVGFAEKSFCFPFPSLNTLNILESDFSCIQNHNP